jgi:hypothetical protein
VTPPCTCDTRRAVAQLARGLIVDVREALEEGIIPQAGAMLGARILCAALALGSEQLAHFLLAADDDQELWRLTDEEVVADAGVSTYDLHLIRVCRSWWPWLHKLRLAREEATNDDVTQTCQVLLATMPTAWFAHASPCPREAA